MARYERRPEQPAPPSPRSCGVIMIEDITPIIITYNEEANIARTLDRLIWARRILVIDSGSTDGTLDIIRSYPRAEVVHRPVR